MPTLRANRAVAATQSISGFLVHIVRGRESRERFTASSSEDSDEDYSEETSSSSSSDTSTSSDTEDELPPSPRAYHTRAMDRNRAPSSRVRTRSGSELSSSNGNFDDSRSERSQSEEVTRDESARTVMGAVDDEVQLIEDDGPFPADRNIRTTPSNSDDELDAVNRPKRRRTGTPASQDDGNPKTSASGGGVASSAMHFTNDDSCTDDGCSICYEDYTSAGEHRLASIKCGHFFGYSCITRGSEVPYQMVIQPVRGGRMFMIPERKEALIIGPANADARAFDYNGDCWAVGVACSQAGNLFCPYGIRMLIINQQEFKLRECYPLHSARSRVVVFSPFESTVLLSGIISLCFSIASSTLEIASFLFIEDGAKADELRLFKR
ncbi:unnamed protein product [Angiostrongylus costaricensis]|uniref:Zf-RING_UBOX domain-containing protein n=1 Tax=Angiostrongylus costaricensis TaxID=334426 RepID=A0A0R3Q278_ANGCS|nr:unnamed protein product [Angiostrongylus costaricensis]